ncbi:hypothetical protein PTW32_11015 [Dechloromonas agitata]|uniref:hypothetical protein n=1 Tax=Dechloromonas agitata TaxID=73030 RepID=UPI00237EB833|nr:hypothetical protein [Dechloromonas agitata]MDE1545950.1 hypothetical protein [Dechloromonas agitata]
MTQTIEQLTARIAELEEEKKELQALLDFDNARLDQIEDELEDVEYLGPFVEGIKVLKTQLTALKVENEALRKDAERYRFIKDEPWSANVSDVICHHQNAAWDNVIDAAMAQGEKGC